MEKKYEGAVFFDYDGTLVDESAGISAPTAKTVEALNALRENGFLVGLATGRVICSLPPPFFDFDCYVLANGAYTMLNGREIDNERIGLTVLREALDYLDGENFNYILESQKRCYCKDKSEKNYIGLVKALALPAEILDSMVHADLENINIFMATFDDRRRFEKFIRRFQDRLEIYMHRFNSSCDVTKKGITKAHGVKAAVDYLRLDVKDTYAFGDSPNDREMLELVGTGVLMKTHSPMLDASAGLITADVKGEGVYEGLKRLRLI